MQARRAEVAQLACQRGASAAWGSAFCSQVRGKEWGMDECSRWCVITMAAQSIPGFLSTRGLRAVVA